MRLSLWFLDEEFVVDPAETFRFGRAGDLVVDEDNLYMHRTVGSIRFHQSLWWLHNESESAPIEIIGGDGLQTMVPAGAQAPLSQTDSQLRFTFGQFNYEIESQLEAPPTPRPIAIADGEDSTSTLRFGHIELNRDQRLMIAALGGESLRSGTRPDAIPANAEVAALLGWTVKKVERKLDHLCSRLTDSGVRGLRGRAGADASDRRRNLIDHAIMTGLTGPGDLDLLEQDVRTRDAG